MKLSIIVFLFLTCIEAHAFDPFSIAMVVKGATDIANTASDIGGVADAFTELYSEVDSDAKISEEGQKMIDEINEIDSLAREAGYTADDISQIGAPSVDEAKKIENAIRSLTKAVRASKRTMHLFQRLERKAQSAQIESTQIEKEQLAQLYKIAREEQSSNLGKIKSELRDQIDKKNIIKALRNMLKEKGAKWFKASGAIAFPKSERVIESAISVSQKLRMPMIGLMLAIFLARLIYYQVGFFGVNAHGDLIRDTIVCAFLLLIYPEIVRGVLNLTLSLANAVTGSSVKEIETGKIVLPKLDGVSVSFITILQYIWEWIKTAGFLIIDFFMNFGMAFMVILFPLVIFFSQMMNFAVAWPLFLGSFAVLSLWPVFWNLIGASAELVWKSSGTSVLDQVYTVLLSILQLVSPIIGLKLLSGSGLQESISAAVAPLTSGASSVVKTVLDAKEGYQAERNKNADSGSTNSSKTSSGGNLSFGRIIGTSAGYAHNKVSNKKQTSGSRNMYGEQVNAKA